MSDQPEFYRIGDAASLLGVRVETLRRWERNGKINTTRSEGGQRQVASSEVARLLAASGAGRPIARESVRNHFAGVITEVKRDGLVATVEIVAGPHRVLSLITREAADDLKLKPGMKAIAAVKATNVTVELSAE
jgi:molybdopterin-binding protein